MSQRRNFRSSLRSSSHLFVQSEGKQEVSLQKILFLFRASPIIPYLLLFIQFSHNIWGDGAKKFWVM